MSTKIEKLEKSRVKLTITVSAEVFNTGLDIAFAEEAKEIEVPGFRKGKIPRAQFEKKFGIARLYDGAINHCINASYGEAVTENNVEVVGQPTIDFDFDKIGQDQEFTYTADVAVKPEVKLGDYEGIKVKHLGTRVLKKDVETEIEALLASKSELITKESDVLENGDTSVIDFEGFKDDVAFEGGKGENHQLKIGSGSFIPGFEEKMIGMKVGENRKVEVTFPAEYQSKDLAGADVVFDVTLHEIKVSNTPELTDELAKELPGDAETVEALEAQLKEQIKTKKEANKRNSIIDTVVQTASDNAEVEVPVEMVASEVERMFQDTANQAKQYGLEVAQFLQFQGTTEEQYKIQLKGKAESSVKFQLVLEAIANKEGLEPTEDKYTETYEMLAKQYGMELEQLKTVFAKDVLKEQLKTQLAVDFLVEKSVKA